MDWCEFSTADQKDKGMQIGLFSMDNTASVQSQTTSFCWSQKYHFVKWQLWFTILIKQKIRDLLIIDVVNFRDSYQKAWVTKVFENDTYLIKIEDTK